MFYIIIAIGIVLAGGIATFAIASVGAPHQARIKAIGLGATTSAFLLFTLINSFTQVPAGHVGVVYQFGGIIGQRSEGLQWIAPWQNVQRASTQVQSWYYKGDTRLGSFSKQTQDVFVEATINLHVSPTAIQNLYRTVGPNWFDVLVNPKVHQFLKDETVKYDTVDIAPHREQLRADVSRRLNDALAPSSINVDDFLLTDIDFRPEFKHSIEQKQIATQKALEQQQLVQVTKYQAEQVRVEAQGKADADLILATQRAKANELLAKSITPTLIQYQTVQKLAPNVSMILLPSNQPLILGADVLKAGK